MFSDWKIIKAQVDNRRAELLLRLLVVSLSLSMLATFRAWVPFGVDYPRVPLFPAFDPEFPLPFLFVNFLFLQICLYALLFTSKRQVIFPLIFFSFAVFISDNVDRFQPWIFIHLPMIYLLGKHGNKSLLHCAWILIFMYFWGGINKINLAFAWDVFPYFMKPFGLNAMFYLPTDEIGTYPLPTLNHLAWLIPFAEILIAVFLLSRSRRKSGVLIAVLMHLFALFILGPLGHNWNSVVWIWNAELLLLVYLLFRSEELGGSSLLVLPLKKAGHVFFILLFGIAPFFWYFGVYPSVLSYHLYSGYNPQVRFWMSAERSVQLKETDELIKDIDFSGVNEKILHSGWIDFTFYDVGRNESFIMVDHYAMQELNIPVMAEEYYFRVLGKKLCNCFGYNDDKAGIRIEHRSKFAAKMLERRYTCRELHNY